MGTNHVMYYEVFSEDNIKTYAFSHAKQFASIVTFPMFAIKINFLL